MKPKQFNDDLIETVSKYTKCAIQLTTLGTETCSPLVMCYLHDSVWSLMHALECELAYREECGKEVKE